MNQKRYVLKNLEIDEVSFVDVGANPHARIIFSKRLEEGDQQMSENNTFAINKSMPNFALVSKCVTKARSKDYSGLTRADIDTAIETITKSVQQSEGVTYEEAYAATMSGPDGVRLYEAREALPAEGEYKPMQKFEVSKSEKLEAEAEHFAKTYNTSIEKARNMVRDFYTDLK